MAKDLTVSRIDRQNILNNDFISEIQETTKIECVVLNDKFYLTKEAVSSYFSVDVRTIERYISSYSDELSANGFEILKGNKLQEFIEAYNKIFATDINVARKIRSLSVFDFRAFLNLAMLLSESEQARALRQLMLDIVIDESGIKNWWRNAKYINQRDKDFVFSSLQEENYRRQFTDALKNYVVDNNYKYATFTDMIYVSIFKEKSKEYKKILGFKASDETKRYIHFTVKFLILLQPMKAVLLMR